MMDIKAMIKRHEGLRLKLYKDTVGKLTIGYGHNIEGLGITQDTALYIFEDDFKKHKQDCISAIPFFNTLDEVRQGVLIDMCFNLGIGKLLKFEKTLSHIKAGRYSDAAAEMLDSKWAVQVGSRAGELAQMMENGE